MPDKNRSSKHGASRSKRKKAFAATMALVNTIMLGTAGSSAKAQDETVPIVSGTNSGGQRPATTSLPPVVITGAGDNGYKADGLSLPKYTEPLLTTPQSATVVTPQLIKDQGVDTLRDSLRNVSGVSIGAGEGSYQGDNFSIRGFAARSDIFMDGMTDFGNYNRDPFNMEEIEVLKGPSSAEFGRGSSGGAVNIESKTPRMDEFVAGSAMYGTNNTQRGTIDYNQPIAGLEGAAFRLNLLADRSDFAGRNDAQYARWGVAPSLSFGIGTFTRLTLSYFHQGEDNVPDYGIPWLFDQPAPVNRANFYGFKSDYFKADVNIGTLHFEHDFNDMFTLREQFRAADYYRSFRISQADTGAFTPSTPLGSADIERDIIDGTSTDRLVDEDINLLSKFDVGPTSNQLITGFEYVHQSVNPRRIEPSWENVPETGLFNPNENQAFTGTGFIDTAVNAHVDTLSAYLTHTMKIGSQWSIIGNLRYDRVSSHYDETVTPTAAFSETSNLFSWRGAIIYQPVEEGSIYVASGTSVHPNIAQLSISSEPTLPPETANIGIGKNFEVEVGTKWELLHKKLLLSGAFFWDEQTNPAEVDLDDPLIDVFHGKERVWGFEFGLVGHLTDDWQLLLNYTYQYGTVTSASDQSLIGHPVLNCPQNTVSLWTTYELPWNFEVGFGLNSVSSRTASESPDPLNGQLMRAPGYVILSAMLKYHAAKNIDIQANVENLTDQYYYDGVHPGHINPGEGRVFYISTNFKF